MITIFYPRLCSGCKEPTDSSFLCEKCALDVKYLSESSICSKCGVPLGYLSGQIGSSLSIFCGRCIRGEYNFDLARSIVFFDGILRDLLHQFKYKGRISIGKNLPVFLMNHFPGDINDFDIIMPVPVYIKKLRNREYNQSAVLGKTISNRLNIEFDPFNLYKVEDTPPQVNFRNYSQRKKNVKNTFSLRYPMSVKNRSVLLFDDVFTSGYTASECAGVLRESGAASIQVLTIFRAQT